MGILIHRWWKNIDQYNDLENNLILSSKVDNKPSLEPRYPTLNISTEKFPNKHMGKYVREYVPHMHQYRSQKHG